MKSLSRDPHNKLKSVRCPICMSTSWYRLKSGKFVCKKCTERFENEMA